MSEALEPASLSSHEPDASSDDPPGSAEEAALAVSQPETDTGAADRADVRAAARRDRAAFDRLVLRHQQAVIDTAAYYLGDYQDALEVAQDAFLKAYRAIGRFRGDATFRTWILRITINTARSLQTRRRAKKRTAPRAEIRTGTPGQDPDSGLASVDIPDSSANPERLLERKELRHELERAISELEPEARAVVVLRDIVGESYEAIATSIGAPIGTVKSKVHRARLVLRDRMERFL